MYLAQNGTSLSHLIPAFPGRTMKKEEAEELVELREHVVSCFFITPGHTPIIPDDGSDLRKDADTQARVVMSSSSHLRERLKGRKPYQPTVLGDKELDALLSSYSGALDGRRRRLVWVSCDRSGGRAESADLLMIYKSFSRIPPSVSEGSVFSLFQSPAPARRWLGPDLLPFLFRPICRGLRQERRGSNASRVCYHAVRRSSALPRGPGLADIDRLRTSARTRCCSSLRGMDSHRRATREATCQLL